MLLFVFKCFRCALQAALFVGFSGSLAIAQSIRTDTENLSLNILEPSILFERDKIEDLGRVLRAYELNDNVNLSDITPEVISAEEEELAPLPVFHYSSLIYRNPQDWKIWLNEKPYTASQASAHQSGESASGSDLHVSLQAKDVIRVVWKPRRQLSQVIAAWQERENKEQSAPYRNRLSVRGNDSTFDLANGTVTFSLYPNQTFVVSSFNTVEGKYTPPIVPVLLTAPSSNTERGVNTNVEGIATTVEAAPQVESILGELLERNASPAAGVDDQPIPNSDVLGSDSQPSDEMERLQKEILKTIFQ